jgi:hypothetical protein
MTKIFLATPAFDGKVNVQYACSLCDTRLCMAANAIDVIVRINTSGSLIVRERNDLLKDFLKTDATHILCIDSDIGWNPYDIKKLVDYDEDFVAALYPARGPDKCFLFRGVYEDENKKMSISEKKLLQMEYIPAGFMLIKRHVIEKMIEYFPELYYEPKDASVKHMNGHHLFATEIWEGEFWGEDYVFCRRARQAGFKIWIDPLIELDHAGNKGCFMQCLTYQIPNKIDPDDPRAVS